MTPESTTDEPSPTVREIDMGGKPRLTVLHSRTPTRYGPDDPSIPATWLQRDIGHGWRVAYNIVTQGSTSVVGEVRIFPAEDEHNPGQWSGDAESVPRGGLTAAVVSKVRTEEPLAQAREIFRSLVPPEEFDRPWFAVAAPLAHDREGGRPRWRDDHQLATIAAAYVRHVDAGCRSPNKAVGLDIGYSAGHVRNRIRDARARDLLTASPRGRAGGALTQKARDLLAATDAA